MAHNLNRKIRLSFFLVAVLTASIVGVHYLNLYAGDRFYSKITTDAAQSVIIKKSDSQKKKNAHVRTNVSVNGSSYKIRYTFRDHKEKTQTINLEYPRVATDQKIRKFGIPSAFLTGIKNTAANQAMLQRQMKSGMYIMKKGKLTPDYNAMIKFYKPYATPIAEFIERAVGKNADINTKVEFALKFCQDIPYCRPPITFNGKITAGLFSPPHTLVNMYSDCDSKSLLLASILKHFKTPPLVLVHVPGHMFMAMKGVPRTYQKSLKYENETYIFLEPTGPRRFRIGESNKKYKRNKGITRVL